MHNLGYLLLVSCLQYM